MYYWKKDEYDEALKIYREALSIQEKLFRKEGTKTANTTGNVGLVYEYKGEYEKALEIYKAELLIKEKVLGNDHPHMKDTHDRIVETTRKLNNKQI